MLAVILGYGLVFLSIYLQLYYWYRWTNMQNSKRISAICKVIVARSLGLIACIVAQIASNGDVYMFFAFVVAFTLLICDVWRLKCQIDETLK